MNECHDAHDSLGHNPGRLIHRRDSRHADRRRDDDRNRRYSSHTGSSLDPLRSSDLPEGDASPFIALTPISTASSLFFSLLRLRNEKQRDGELGNQEHQKSEEW